MYVNVRINSKTPRGKQLLKELKRYPETVKFDNPAESGIVPEGYVTAEEFRERVKKKIMESCKENGII